MYSNKRALKKAYAQFFRSLRSFKKVLFLYEVLYKYSLSVSYVKRDSKYVSSAWPWYSLKEKISKHIAEKINQDIN